MKHEIAIKLIRDQLAHAKTRRVNLERELHLLGIEIGELNVSLAYLCGQEPLAHTEPTRPIDSGHAAYVIIASGPDRRVAITSTEIGLTKALGNLSPKIGGIDYTRTMAFAFHSVQVARAVSSALHKAHEPNRWPDLGNYIYTRRAFDDATGVMLYGASIMRVADIIQFDTPERHVVECSEQPEGTNAEEVFAWLLSRYAETPSMRKGIQSMLAGLSAR